MWVLSLDWETTSAVDLKKVGAWVYSQHSTTRLLLASWSLYRKGTPLKDRVMKRWRPDDALATGELADAISQAQEIHAFNAPFEHAILTNMGPRYGLPVREVEAFHCTMARALYWGLPPKLEQAVEAAHLPHKKDMAGHRLMLKLCKPRKPRKGEPDALYWWDQECPELLDGLHAYCDQDVWAEMGLEEATPPLPTYERMVWLLDRKMDRRGLELDTSLVSCLHHAADRELDRLSDALAQVTAFAVRKTTQGERLKDWLRGRGVEVDSLDKENLPLVLAQPMLKPEERRALELFSEGAKSSTKKLTAMLNFRAKDGRIRGLIQYYGAFRTGRFAGRGPQIQNYPRPMRGLDVAQAIRDFQDDVPLEDIRFLHGDPLAVISSCLRGCYVAAEGCKLAVCDYSAIEARVVAWLAGQIDLLEVFRRDEDPYLYAAALQGSKNRQFGKVLVLALGYGMGAAKFVEAAATYGVILTEEQAQAAVEKWREANADIVRFWYACQDAAIKVITRQAERVQVGFLEFRMAKREGKLAGAMILKLPSGRELVYREARYEKIEVRDESGEVVRTETAVTYMGLNQYTKKWERLKTWGGKIVENATQAVARCLLVDAMLQLDQRHVPLLTTIHDELIAEPLVHEADETLRTMRGVMGTAPPWAPGLPVKGEGKTMYRYGKA